MVKTLRRNAPLLYNADWLSVFYGAQTTTRAIDAELNIYTSALLCMKELILKIKLYPNFFLLNLKLNSI